VQIPLRKSFHDHVSGLYLYLDPDPAAAFALANRIGRAAATERVAHQLARCRCLSTTRSSTFVESALARRFFDLNFQ